MSISLKKILHKIPYLNYLLAISVIFTVFFVPLLPAGWQKLAYSTLFTLIYFMAALSMERHRKTFIILAISLFILEWFSSFAGFRFLYEIARSLTVIFFIVIVINLIREIARSKEVDSSVILDAINGYLLLIIVFALLVAILSRVNPGSFNFQPDLDTTADHKISYTSALYFSLVTATTLGYGDITPQTQVARSLSTLIAVSGQLYIAIIIALLVGKFAARKGK